MTPGVLVASRDREVRYVKAGDHVITCMSAYGGVGHSAINGAAIAGASRIIAVDIKRCGRDNAEGEG